MFIWPLTLSMILDNENPFFSSTETKVLNWITKLNETLTYKFNIILKLHNQIEMKLEIIVRTWLINY